MSSTARSGRTRALAASFALALVAIAVSGCATAARFREADIQPVVLQDYLKDKPEPVQAHYATLLRQGQRNAVLNHARAGLGALELGAYDVAKTSFDQALLGIEAVYAQSDTAAQARKLWTAEAYKDFKGEPYERAMTYYYRGLLYLRDGDYENARASFKGGLLQDAFAEDEQNRSDFALLAFLEGWASRCAGNSDLAAQSFAEVTSVKSEFQVPKDGENVLLIAETGTAPIKFGDGPKRSLLKFRRGDGFDERKVKFELGGDKPVDAFALEDIYWQASTRGGRPIDHILAGKVEFQETGKVAGQVATAIGAATLAVAMRQRSNAGMIAGGAILLLGIAAQAAADAARPEADARYWDNLPDGIHVATVSLTDETPTVDVKFFDSSDALLEPLSKTVDIARAGTCALAWSRARSAIPSDPRAPGTITQTGQ